MLPAPRSNVSPYPSCPCPLKPQHLTLPSSCGQQQASTCTQRMGQGGCRVFRSAMHRFPAGPAAVLASFLARATATVQFTCPSLFHLSGLGIRSLPRIPSVATPFLIMQLVQMGAAGASLSRQGEGHLRDASRVKEHEGLTGDKHHQSVDAPSITRCWRSVSQNAAKSREWCHVLWPIMPFRLFIMSLDPSPPHLTSTTHV